MERSLASGVGSTCIPAEFAGGLDCDLFLPMNELEILFCMPGTSDQHNPQLNAEVEAVGELGLNSHLVRTEDVVDGHLDRLERALPPGQGQPLLYRGFMLTEEEYDQLYDELVRLGYSPVTNPADYAEMHYLPNYYPAIEKLASPATWIWDTDLDEAWEAASSLGEPPYLVKDHVKSAKEDWSNSCFIPPGADREVFDRTCKSFIEFRGDRFERGLAFRRFLPLRKLGESDQGYPIHDEYRLFFWQGQLLMGEAYHELGGEQNDFSRFELLGEKFGSPFFTADVAQLENGEWMIIEMGDGGVSALPPLVEPFAFYELLLGEEEE